MNEKKYFIFAYGSLMSETSQIKTISEDHIDLGPDVLSGYRRIFNYQHGPEIYLNLREESGSSVYGLVIAVGEEDFNLLRGREAGYRTVDVSEKLSKQYREPVYAFIAEPNASNGCITKRYINLCLEGVPKEDHDKWLSETVIDHPFCK